METTDAFDFKEESPKRSRRGKPATIWNLLTGLVLLTTLCVGILLLTIFLNPYIAFNPFKPPALPTLYTLPTATPTPKYQLPPTWTPTATPLPTNTPEPSPTPLPTETVVPTLAPETPAATVEGGMPYVLLQGDPKAVPNIGQPLAGCNWTGVAGQALGIDGAPVIGVFIELTGTFSGQSVYHLTMTGLAPQYGPGGYEITLGDRPLDSDDALTVQLFDQAMLPLSDKVTFDTFEDCDRNLILVNFKQVR
jgi:hypothetical protein